MPVRYRELYEEGRRVLEDVPIPDAALDARLLLEAACGSDLQTLLVYPDRLVDDAAAARYRALIERRRLREPTAMILGEWEFMGLPFLVTKDTLIPEQDTEVLVETVLERVGAADLMDRYAREGSAGSSGVEEDADRPGEAEKAREFHILDLCTGSGCILLALLHFLPRAEGIGTDISEGALSAAGENAKKLGLSGRTLFYQGDLWEALPGPKERFDLIVSNPPYVPTDVIATLEPEVRCGEPFAALDGGPDGLSFYRRIIAQAPRYLKKGGLLALESGFDEAAAIRPMMEQAGFADLRVDRDYGGLDRVVSGIMPR